MDDTPLVSINEAARALGTPHYRIRTYCKSQGVRLVAQPHPKNGRKCHLLPRVVLDEWLRLGPICADEECDLRVCRTPEGFLTARCQYHHDRRHCPVGTRRTAGDGYVMVKTAETGAKGHRWRAEHRMIMEEVLGRSLEAHENVHHINGVRDDNRLENLELWLRPQTAGQRVSDLIEYLTTHHRNTLLAALEAEK